MGRVDLGLGASQAVTSEQSPGRKGGDMPFLRGRELKAEGTASEKVLRQGCAGTGVAERRPVCLAQSN